MEQNKNHKIQNGGKREGAGRPKGSSNKPKITDFMNDDDIKLLMARYLARAQEEDRVMIHLVENVLGKARQNIGLDGGEDNKPISILNDAILANHSNNENIEPEQED